MGWFAGGELAHVLEDHGRRAALARDGFSRVGTLVGIAKGSKDGKTAKFFSAGGFCAMRPAAADDFPDPVPISEALDALTSILLPSTYMGRRL